ncbi:MAG: hypothetical protein Q8O93_00675 [bacterium]|nr:hypothetical protein [bacterium]
MGVADDSLPDYPDLVKMNDLVKFFCLLSDKNMNVRLREIVQTGNNGCGTTVP